MSMAGMLPKNEAKMATCSGIVIARVRQYAEKYLVEITQPQGEVHSIHETDEILAVLRISREDLAPWPVLNACTSRVKTLIPLKSVTKLNALQPHFERVRDLCERLGSTGLYPYAVVDCEESIFEARQFPKSSGCPEEAATRIAAAALAYGLRANEVIKDGSKITVNQGRAMGCLSEIVVRFENDGWRYWIGVDVRLEENV